MNCKYVREHYGVPAEIGRRVVVYGKRGVIAEDRGHYIGVNFDTDKPGVIHNAHPTSEVEYGKIGTIRKMTKAQSRYARWLEYGECFDNFLQFCYWDASEEREWNR